MVPVLPTAAAPGPRHCPSRIWAAYEQVRGYEPVLRWADVETLHELRIAGKWLRYTLEFVREALGDDAAPLIARVTALQDHLGLMNDADVPASMARTFLVEHAGELSGSRARPSGATWSSREREVARLRRTHRAAVARRRRRHASGGRSGGSSPASSRGRRLGSPAVGQVHEPVAPGSDRRGRRRGSAPSRTPASETRSRSAPYAPGSRRRSPPRPAGSGRGSGLIRCRSEATAAGSAARIASTSRDPLAREGPIQHRGRKHLEQVRRGAADRDDLGRVRRWGAGDHARAPRHASPRPRRSSPDRVSTNRSVSRADPSCRPVARGRWVRVDDAELGAAAADVDDEGLVGDRHALGHADDREIGLLRMGQDVDRRTRCGERPRGRPRRRRPPGGSVRCRGT